MTYSLLHRWKSVASANVVSTLLVVKCPIIIILYDGMEARDRLTRLTEQVARTVVPDCTSSIRMEFTSS